MLPVWLVMLLLGPVVCAQPPDHVTPDPNQPALPNQPAPPPRVTLALHLRPGQSFTTRLEWKQQTLQAFPGHAGDAQQNIALVLNQRVEHVEADGSCTLVVRYRELRAQIGEGGQAFTYDSTHPVATPDLNINSPGALLAAIFASLQEQPFTIKLRPTGIIQEMRGQQELGDRMRQKLTALLPKEMNPAQVTAILEGIRDEIDNQFALQQSSTTVFFSDQPVQIGEAWRTPAPAPADAPLRKLDQCVLKSREAGVAELRLGGELTMHTQPRVPDGAMARSLAITGVQLGEATVDEATGWTRRLDAALFITGTTTIKVGTNPPIVIPVLTRATIHQESIEDPPPP